MSNNTPQKQPGQLAVIYFKVTIGVGLLVVFFMSLLIVTFCVGKNLSDNKDRDSVLDFIIKTISAGLGIVSVYYVGDSIRSVARARNDEENLRKIDRALKLIERWNSPSYNHLRKTILRKVTSIRDLEPDRFKHPVLIKEEMLSDLAFNSCVTDLMNFLEEICLSVNQKLVDEKIVKEYFVAIIASYLSLFSVWIDYRKEQAIARLLARKETSGKIYENVQSLNVKWDNEEKTPK